MKQYLQCLRFNPSTLAERISHYRIVSKLGAGVGEGYQAQGKPDRNVACKVLPAGLANRAI